MRIEGRHKPEVLSLLRFSIVPFVSDAAGAAAHGLMEPHCAIVTIASFPATIVMPVAVTTGITILSHAKSPLHACLTDPSTLESIPTEKSASSTSCHEGCRLPWLLVLVRGRISRS